MKMKYLIIALLLLTACQESLSIKEIEEEFVPQNIEEIRYFTDSVCVDDWDYSAATYRHEFDTLENGVLDGVDHAKYTYRCVSLDIDSNYIFDTVYIAVELTDAFYHPDSGWQKEFTDTLIYDYNDWALIEEEGGI